MLSSTKLKTPIQPLWLSVKITNLTIPSLLMSLKLIKLTQPSNSKPSTTSLMLMLEPKVMIPTLMTSQMIILEEIPTLVPLS